MYILGHRASYDSTGTITILLPNFLAPYPIEDATLVDRAWAVPTCNMTRSRAVKVSRDSIGLVV